MNLHQRRTVCLLSSALSWAWRGTSTHKNHNKSSQIQHLIHRVTESKATIRGNYRGGTSPTPHTHSPWYELNYSRQTRTEKICICRSGCDHPPKVWTHPTMHSKFGVALLFGSGVTACHSPLHSPLLPWSNFWQHSSQYCEAPRLFHCTWLLPPYFPEELRGVTDCWLLQLNGGFCWFLVW